MSANLIYNNEVITPIEGGQTLKLLCKDKTMEHDIEIQVFGSGGAPAWDGSFTKGTDLTGTTWVIPSGWVTAAHQGRYAITGELTVGNNTMSITSFNLGVYSADNTVTYQENTLLVVKAEDGTAHGLTSAANTTGFTLKITGGTGATSKTLAAWLRSEGKIAGTSLITFTIENDDGDVFTRYAENGMTWADWAASHYNDIGVTATADSTVQLDGTAIVVSGTSTVIASTATIISDTAYVTKSTISGGSGN